MTTAGTERRCANAPTASELRARRRNAAWRSSMLACHVGRRKSSASPVMLESASTFRKMPVPFIALAPRLPAVALMSRRRAPPSRL
jgi:hypothetical protein